MATHAVDVNAIQAMIAQSIAAAMAQVAPAPAPAPVAEAPKSKGKAKHQPAPAPVAEAPKSKGKAKHQPEPEPEPEPTPADTDGTASIDAKGIVTLHFQPTKWEKGKRAMSLRGSGDRGEVLCDGLYNGRGMRFYVRGWLASK